MRALGALALGFLFGLMAPTTSAHQTEPGCQEDEVYAIQRDPNPEHGLTWACENTEQFLLRH